MPTNSDFLQNLKIEVQQTKLKIANLKYLLANGHVFSDKYKICLDNAEDKLSWLEALVRDYRAKHAGELIETTDDIDICPPVLKSDTINILRITQGDWCFSTYQLMAVKNAADVLEYLVKKGLLTEHNL